MKKTKQNPCSYRSNTLTLMYVAAFIVTILDHTSDMRYWKAAMVATVIIPVLIWAYSFVYKLIKGSDDDEKKDK